MIRRAVGTDAARIVAIVTAAYTRYIPRIGRKPGPMLDDYGARILADQVWVLEDLSEMRSVLVLENTPAQFLLDNIAVAPEFHGAGYGRALLMFAEQEAVRRGHDAIHLYTHALMTENISLYRRIGYTETRRVIEKGFNRVYMVKNLAQRGP